MPSRGFVTIATGDERYYDIARNLLQSYRMFASIHYPFAILCDRENEYTKDFDDVCLLEKAHCNYLDKLQLYEYLPYDESIFIDADSLAYGDLDEWWDVFKDADDFSLFGYAWTDLKSGRGWFVPAGAGEFKDRITYIPDFNGGVYYMRRSERCKKVFELANYFALNFKNYTFNDFTTPADEPCLALAMAIEQCMPLDLKEKGLVFAPKRKNIELDITRPIAFWHGNTEGGYAVYLVHWSNYRTKLSLYKFEAEKLDYLTNEKNDSIRSVRYKILYKWGFRYYFLCIFNIGAYFDRLCNKIRKMLENRNDV